jgi:hypothetical protein
MAIFIPRVSVILFIVDAVLGRDHVISEIEEAKTRCVEYPQHSDDVSHHHRSIGGDDVLF